MVAELRQQELGAAGHRASAIGKWRAMNAGTRHTFSFGFSPGPLPVERRCSQLRWVFQPQINRIWMVHTHSRRVVTEVILDCVSIVYM